MQNRVSTKTNVKWRYQKHDWALKASDLPRHLCVWEYRGKCPLKHILILYFRRFSSCQPLWISNVHIWNVSFSFQNYCWVQRKKTFVLVMGYRIERWTRVPDCKQGVLFDVGLLLGLQLPLRTVLDWSLCARQSGDGVGCLRLSWIPPWAVVICLKMRRKCYHSWDTELGLFLHPNLFLECSVQDFVLRCLPYHSIL